MECARCGIACPHVLTKDGRPYRESGDKQRMLEKAAQEPDHFLMACFTEGYESILLPDSTIEMQAALTILTGRR